MSESLSPRELDVLAHSTGWDARRKRDRLYRNHYCAGPGHHSQSVLEALCERGLMRNHGTDPDFLDGSLYTVTEQGIALLKRFRP